MNKLVLLGLFLMLLGGALVVFDEFSYDKKHERTVLGTDFSVTTRETKKIPVAVSGTILGVGALVTVIGAAKRKGRA